MVEEGVLNRWMGLELGRVAKALVSVPRPVGDLLVETDPKAVTRGGEPYVFDRSALEAFAALLSPLERRRVKVPIVFWVDKDAMNDAYVQEEQSMVAVRAVGGVPPDREARNGKLWLSHPLARETANAYPTLFQFVYF